MAAQFVRFKVPASAISGTSDMEIFFRFISPITNQPAVAYCDLFQNSPGVAGEAWIYCEPTTLSFWINDNTYGNAQSLAENVLPGPVSGATAMTKTNFNALPAGVHPLNTITGEFSPPPIGNGGLRYPDGETVEIRPNKSTTDAAIANGLGTPSGNMTGSSSQFIGASIIGTGVNTVISGTISDSSFIGTTPSFDYTDPAYLHYNYFRGNLSGGQWTPFRYPQALVVTAPPTTTITTDPSTDKPTGVTLSGGSCTTTFGAWVIKDNATNNVVAKSAAVMSNTSVSALQTALNSDLITVLAVLGVGKYTPYVWLGCATFTLPTLGVAYTAPSGATATTGVCFQKCSGNVYLLCSGTCPVAPPTTNVPVSGVSCPISYPVIYNTTSYASASALLAAVQVAYSGFTVVWGANNCSFDFTGAGTPPPNIVLSAASTIVKLPLISQTVTKDPCTGACIARLCYDTSMLDDYSVVALFEYTNAAPVIGDAFVLDVIDESGQYCVNYLTTAGVDNKIVAIGGVCINGSTVLPSFSIDDIVIVSGCACKPKCTTSPVLDSVIDGDNVLTAKADLGIFGENIFFEKKDTVSGLTTPVGDGEVMPDGSVRFEFDVAEMAHCGYIYRAYFECDGKRIYSNEVLAKKKVCCGDDCGCGGSGCGDCGSSDDVKCLIEATKINLELTSESTVQITDFEQNLALNIGDTQFRLNKVDVWGDLAALNTKIGFGSSFQFRAKSNKTCIKTVIVPNIKLPEPCATPKTGAVNLPNVVKGSAYSGTLKIDHATKVVLTGVPYGMTVTYTTDGNGILCTFSGAASDTGSFIIRYSSENRCVSWRCSGVVINEIAGSLTVIGKCATPTIIKQLSKKATVGEYFEDTIVVGPATTATVTGLPAGFTAGAAVPIGCNVEIKISGTPTDAGVSEIKVNANNDCCGGLNEPTSANNLDGGKIVTKPSEKVMPLWLAKDCWGAGTPDIQYLVGVGTNDVWEGKAPAASAWKNLAVSPDGFVDSDLPGLFGKIGLSSDQFQLKMNGGLVSEFVRAFHACYDPDPVRGTKFISATKEKGKSYVNIAVELTDTWFVSGGGWTVPNPLNFTFTIKMYTGATVGGSTLINTTQTVTEQKQRNLLVLETVNGLSDGQYTFEITMPNATIVIKTITITTPAGW